MVSSSGCAARIKSRFILGLPRVAARHFAAELRELLDLDRRARMVLRFAQVLRCKAERQRYVERLERLHLRVEPVPGLRTEAVGPAQPGPHMLDAQLLEPANGVL